MAGLKPVRALGRQAAAWAERWLPDSLFGRLALLLGVAVVTSHVLALTLMFELHPRPGMDRPPVAMEAAELPPPPHFRGPDGPPGPPTLGLLLDIAVRLGALLLAAWVGARWLSDPVRRLAGAARELGLNIHRAPLPEAGTLECREATRVFNQMQQHIRAQLEQRDQFVAAVSHDLRTPLTRLALRVESLPDAEDRRRFGKDIAEMDTMIRATLDYLRGAADAEPWVALDLASLVGSLVEDQQDCGHDVAVDMAHATTLAPVRAQASALRRCITNLLDNAVRYGGGALVRLTGDAEGVRVSVLDRGPGIPETELAKVLQPFYRVEASRNRNSGGVGLGLATASDIARQHGGGVQLSNRAGGGLRADLLLPRKAVEPKLLLN
ncbi:ATP-binding protein [Rhodoferax saidenbachensis]|uniref:histidine kinase n=1 Tax=Rhodoferax saidenbachensis TaxID=1484693 RepID=A0ABU1ZT86_9BURK|nr:ATP-binding protein [Rhodoferax saidenbachensis]MDR7308758.1 protein-histidine pros-kinase [Rhodoferax saidenbachensis]